MSNRIKELRQEKGITQQELANYLSVSRQSVSLYETDKRTPNKKVENKLTSLFKDDVIKKVKKEYPYKLHYLQEEWIYKYIMGYGLLDHSDIEAVITWLNELYFKHFEYIKIKDEDIRRIERKVAEFNNAVDDYVKHGEIFPKLRNFYSKQEKDYKVTSEVFNYWIKNFYFLFEDLDNAERLKHLRNEVIHATKITTIFYTLPWITRTIRRYDFKNNSSEIGTKINKIFLEDEKEKQEEFQSNIIFSKDKEAVLHEIDKYINYLNDVKAKIEDADL